MLKMKTQRKWENKFTVDKAALSVCLIFHQYSIEHTCLGNEIVYTLKSSRNYLDMNIKCAVYFGAGKKVQFKYFKSSSVGQRPRF